MDGIRDASSSTTALLLELLAPAESVLPSSGKSVPHLLKHASHTRTEAVIPICGIGTLFFEQGSHTSPPHALNLRM